MPRLSSKDKYIREILNLYKEKGLRLNMEQIADELHITKKTLYNNFENKEDMITTVVDHFFFDLERKILTSVEESENAIDSLIKIVEIIRFEIDKLGPSLIDDISKESINMFDHSNNRSSFYSKVIKENLSRGISEGLYRHNVDPEYSTIFYTSAIEFFYKKGHTQRFIRNSSKYHSELVKHHLYSIIRADKIDILESYLK